MDNFVKELPILLTKGEKQTIEFKTSFQKEVIESVVAFANSQGGRVVIGISDSGEIIGATLQAESLQNWVNQIKLNTQPSIIVDMLEVEIENKTIVVIDVKEYPIKPISYKNRYFVRKSNSNHLMSMLEISTMHLQFKLFDDSITIFNPGKLYGDLSIEDLHTDSYQSRTRNKLIAEAFYLTGDIEKYGSGYIRVREEIKQYPTMVFDYKEVGNGYLVTLSYTQQKTSTQTTPQETPQENTKEKIISLLSRNGVYTIKEIAQMLDKHVDTIKEHIGNLKKEGRLKRKGSTKSGSWVVLNKRDK